MEDSLFQGLPPPSAPPRTQLKRPPPVSEFATENESQAKPPLKSALKRSKPAVSDPPQETAAPEKRLRFKTTTDASETQVIEAMQKIASHIKTPSKFSKASKLAIQLVQAGSIKPGTSDYFFCILEAAMSSPTSCNDTSVREDYHALFSAAQDTVEFLTMKQRNQLTAWTIRAVVANDLFTDDSFVFSKASTRIKELISDLPLAKNEDDTEEAAALREGTNFMDADDDQTESPGEAVPPSQGDEKEEKDPFGLDALIPSVLKRDEKGKVKKDASTRSRNDEEKDTKRFLRSQREALVLSLEIAARRYKVTWCQTAIDILVKHAFDNISRFTAKQRDAIEKLWVSIREQHVRRKQGKSVSGKLDVNAFEWLQQKYANEKISIRHSVGGSGDRRAQQWLG